MSSSNRFRSMIRSTRNSKRRTRKLSNKDRKEVKQWTYNKYGSTTKYTYLYLIWCFIKLILVIPKDIFMIVLAGLTGKE